MIMKMKSKKNVLKPHQMIALVCALTVPALYIVSIVLFVIDNQYAELFLAVAVGISVFIMPVMYLLTKVPKDMAEIYSNIVTEIRKHKD